MIADRDSPIGKWGKVTLMGAIPEGGKYGEVAIRMGGGLQFYYATHVDGKSIEPETEVLVIYWDKAKARTVQVMTKDEVYS